MSRYHAMPWYVMSCHTLLCHAISCHVMSCYVCHVTSSFSLSVPIRKIVIALNKYNSSIFFYSILAISLLLQYILSTTDDKKEVEETKKRYNELSEKLTEKNRQYLKLQVGNYSTGGLRIVERVRFNKTS